MPELPDIAAYITALEPRVMGLPLERVRLANPFLLRTTTPPLSEAEGRTVRELRRVGKRIAIGLEGGLWLVLHLMIAGRLHWKPAHAALRGRQNLAAFDFPPGSLTLTEAGAKRRASLHVVAGEPGLLAMDPGGIDVLSADPECFRAALIRENRTLKRALTDPRIVSGVGNAYSDEILHAAQLSPIALTHKLKSEEWERLFSATRSTLAVWMDRLHAEALESFFRLFEAEQEMIQLRQGLSETEAMQTFVETAQPQENAPPIDKSLPKRRKLELLRQMAEADMLCLQLNNRLRLLLG